MQKIKLSKKRQLLFNHHVTLSSGCVWQKKKVIMGFIIINLVPCILQTGL